MSAAVIQGCTPEVCRDATCRRGLKLNPITSLYYISPACFGFLLLPFFCFELPKIRNDPSVVISPAVLLSNATAAFGAPQLPVVCAPRLSHPCMRTDLKDPQGPLAEAFLMSLQR